MTITDLAAACGLSHNYLSKRLKDDMPFNLNDLERVGIALGIQSESLIAGAAGAITRGSLPYVS